MDFSLWFSFFNNFFFLQINSYFNLFTFLFSAMTHKRLFRFSERKMIYKMSWSASLLSRLCQNLEWEMIFATRFFFANREGPQIASIRICLWHTSHAVFRTNVLVWKILLKASVLLIFFPLLLSIRFQMFHLQAKEGGREEERDRETKRKKNWMASNRFG